MDRKSFTIISGTVLFFLIVSALIISQMQGVSFSVLSDNGDMLTVKQDSWLSQFFSSFTVTARTDANMVSGLPGEKINVRISPINNRDTIPPLITANVLLYDEKYNIVNIWNVYQPITQSFTCYNFLGCKQSIQSSLPVLAVSLDAPSTPGQYRLVYSLSDKDGEFARETAVFTVISSVVMCPKNFCSAWENTGTTTGGVYSSRQCTTYDTACAEKFTLEYKTQCNSGYQIKGQTGTVSNDYVYCEKATSVTPTTTPTPKPTQTVTPKPIPSQEPSVEPSVVPTTVPTIEPTVIPTTTPTITGSCDDNAYKQAHPEECQTGESIFVQIWNRLVALFDYLFGSITT